jgi:hypothetical protein
MSDAACNTEICCCEPMEHRGCRVCGVLIPEEPAGPLLPKQDCGRRVSNAVNVLRMLRDRKSHGSELASAGDTGKKHDLVLFKRFAILNKKSTIARIQFQQAPVIDPRIQSLDACYAIKNLDISNSDAPKTITQALEL